MLKRYGLHKYLYSWYLHDERNHKSVWNSPYVGHFGHAQYGVHPYVVNTRCRVSRFRQQFRKQCFYTSGSFAWRHPVYIQNAPNECARVGHNSNRDKPWIGLYEGSPSGDEFGKQKPYDFCGQVVDGKHFVSECAVQKLNGSPCHFVRRVPAVHSVKHEILHRAFHQF